MSCCYSYDGTLAGLLTLYARLLPERVAVERISAVLLDQQSLFSSEICIVTELTVAEAFWQRLNSRLSDNSLKLLRVPGIGVRSAQRIIQTRRQGHLGIDDLTRLGIVMKRARYFITARGQYVGESGLESSSLRSRLVDAPKQRCPVQLSLDLEQPVVDETASLITGEL